MARTTKDCARWKAASEALQHVTGWLAFRWLYAQCHNHHKPVGKQVKTKAAAAERAGRLVEVLGGDLRALPPRSLETDPMWLAWIRAAGECDQDQQRTLMHRVLDSADLDTATRLAAGDTMRSMDLLLIDMQVQQRMNADGWVMGEGPRSRPRPARARRQ